MPWYWIVLLVLGALAVGGLIVFGAIMRSIAKGFNW